LASLNEIRTNTSRNLSGLGNVTLDSNIGLWKMQNKHWISISIKYL
jgi:hypothetical protein